MSRCCRLPRLVKRWLFQGSLWLLQGPPSRYRMPDPDYAIDQAHPTMTDEIPRLVAHGKLTVKPEIARFDGERVVFKDGTAETIDTVVFATGYQPVIPFMDERLFFRAGRRAAPLRQRRASRARAGCSRRGSCRPTAACGGSPTTRAS